MPSMIVDASVALGWHIGDEVTPGVVRILDNVFEGGGIVPSLWPLEVANGLLLAAKEGRVDQTEMDHVLAELALVPIEIDTLTGRQAWARTWKLAKKHGLTPYDACYLELALRLDLPLATLDGKLSVAAAKEGVLVLN